MDETITPCKILSQVPAWLPNASKQPHLEIGIHSNFNDMFRRWPGDFQTIQAKPSAKEINGRILSSSIQVACFYHDSLTRPLHCQTTRCLLKTYEPKTATDVRFESDFMHKCKNEIVLTPSGPVVCYGFLLQVVPGRAGGGSFRRKKWCIARKEFAYRMRARRPTSAMPKPFLCCERAFCCSMVLMCRGGDLTSFDVMRSVAG